MSSKLVLVTQKLHKGELNCGNDHRQFITNYHLNLRVLEILYIYHKNIKNLYLFIYRVLFSVITFPQEFFCFSYIFPGKLVEIVNLPFFCVHNKTVTRQVHF